MPGPQHDSTSAAQVFEDLHQRVVEPWGADQRWYEERKRALVLACLPRQRFRLGVEPGCSTGVLTAELASRCDRLRAFDVSPAAVLRARRRLDGHRHVEVVESSLDDWPVADEEQVDLVVLSEVGYFLDSGQLTTLAERLRGALADDGVVVLCHWRHEVDGWPLDGPEVHRRLTASGALPPVVASYRDRDVEVLVLSDWEQLPRPDR